jgi:tetratricopeptide (TPR) repeat protein
MTFRHRKSTLVEVAAFAAATFFSIVVTTCPRAHAYSSQTQPPSPPQAPESGQIDGPRSRDVFEQDAVICPGSPRPGCAPIVFVEPPHGGVSARRLAHKPPKAAAKAFDRGLKAWKKGQSEQALQYLREAVGLDPSFAEARTVLGVMYGKTGWPQEALEQYERALELEPNLAMLHSDKAAALVMLSRWEEAEQAARRALQLDPGSIAAHYMLGIAMLKQAKITPETAAHLAIAAKEHPKARAFLAEVEADLAAEPRR